MYLNKTGDSRRKDAGVQGWVWVHREHERERVHVLFSAETYLMDTSSVYKSSLLRSNTTRGRCGREELRSECRVCSIAGIAGCWRKTRRGEKRGGECEECEECEEVRRGEVVRRGGGGEQRWRSRSGT